jgi:hypothetical protein
MYRVAEVCPNGHVSTNSAHVYPEQREAFCSRCGEQTMTECGNCGAAIRGEYEADGIFIAGIYEPPAYCHNCGQAFPWTERKIDAAVELVQTGGDLSESEIAQFRQDLGELVKDTPKIQVASVRFKATMQKVGSTVASGVRDIVVDIVSETAKKAIWGQ